MTHPTGYILGQSDRAAQRLAIQDAHFAAISEQLLDDLALRPADRVVELGCGPGSFTRRILARLGPDGVVVGVDSTLGLLEQAEASLQSFGPTRFEPLVADISKLGPWLDGADVVVGRAVLHHVPMAEFLVGRLRAGLQPGTRVGFLEPDFRAPLARLAYLEATGRPELAPLGIWATAMNRLYSIRQLSPAVGASLAEAMVGAGYRNVRAGRVEFPSDALAIENMVMVYDEIRDQLDAAGILSSEEAIEQQRLLKALPAGPLPAVWGLHRVAGEV